MPMLSEDAKSFCSYTVAICHEIQLLLQQDHLPRLNEIACLESVELDTGGKVLWYSCNPSRNIEFGTTLGAKSIIQVTLVLQIQPFRQSNFQETQPDPLCPVPKDSISSYRR